MNIYWKCGVAVALLVVGFLGGCSWKQRELNQVKDAYAEQVQLALQENREIERRLQNEADSITQKYQKEQKDAQKTIADLRSRIASGDIRLSVPVHPSGMPGGSSPEPGEARAELDGETAQSLVSIAADGDSAIRELNMCLDRYNAVRGAR